MTSTLASSFQGNLYFAIFLLVGAFGLIFGYFTVRGSGINNHPSDGRGGTPGSKLPDEFHQFADRQAHDADARHAKRDAREHGEMTIDDINRRLAEEAAARKATKREHTPAP